MYGKHFQSTYTGSMVGSGPVIFAVWGYIIAHIRDSMVELNPTIIGAILGCEASQIVEAIDVLCSTDERSRTKDHDGKRLIKESEFAYFVPSYEKYHNIRNENERREYMRDYMRKYRAKSSNKDDVNVNVNISKPQLAYSDSDLDSEKDKNTNSAKAESIPYQKIIDLYHKVLDGLPKVAKLTSKRKSQIRQRWASDIGTLDQWENFFDYVSKSDFLMGKKPPTNGRPSFRADIEWLTNETNFTKIAENKYHGQ